MTTEEIRKTFDTLRYDGRPISIKDECDFSAIHLVREFAFYGHIFMLMPRVDVNAGHRIPTLGVGKQDIREKMITLYINVDYVKECYVRCFQKFGPDAGKHKAFNHLLEVYKHEILHIVLGHLNFSFPDKKREGYAVDMAANSYVNRDMLLPGKDGSPGGIFAEDFDLPKDESALWYYNQLLNNKKFNGGGGSGSSFADAVSSHNLWKVVAADEMSEMLLKDMVNHSTRVCSETKDWGNIPQSLKDTMIEQLQPEKPQIPWQLVLKQFIARSTETNLEFTMRRRSKRFDTRPGTKQEEILNLAIGIDTSGSVSDKQLSEFFQELYWVNKTGANIYIYEADTEISAEYPYKEYTGRRSSCGGTDLSPILEEVSKKRFDALIYFTDFEAPMVSEIYNFPIMWVLSQTTRTPENYPYPKGLVMHLDEDMNCKVE